MRAFVAGEREEMEGRVEWGKKKKLKNEKQKEKVVQFEKKKGKSEKKIREMVYSRKKNLTFVILIIYIGIYSLVDHITFFLIKLNL